MQGVSKKKSSHGFNLSILNFLNDWTDPHVGSYPVAVESYYDLSSCMSCFQTPESLNSLAQRVGSVDDRGYLSCLHEIAQDDQVLVPQSRHKYDEALAHESRQHQPFERMTQKGPYILSSDDDEFAIGV